MESTERAFLVGHAERGFRLPEVGPPSYILPLVIYFAASIREILWKRSALLSLERVLERVMVKINNSDRTALINIEK